MTMRSDAWDDQAREGGDEFFKTLPHGGQMQVTTDNSAVLVNALAEIERLKEVINLQVENYAELKEQQEAQHGYFNSVLNSIDRKDAALRVALDALKGAPDVDRVMETAITTISEALA